MFTHGFDNPRHQHSALGWKSPVAFERKAAYTSTCGGIKAGQVHSFHFSYKVTQLKIDLQTLIITFWGEILFLVIDLEANF